ncbi:MAG: nuclear transport factor 2 family protein, partial [Candidatus Puniceispirillum sp.]
MKGFDSRWKDFPDYIIGITEQIWEQRGIASLEHYYTPDIPVRSPGSVVIGNKDVIAATMATLAEFPDRQLLGEDVIWSGSPEEGMLSSHRIFSTATHSADGVYGKATGTKLSYRVIADCHA